VSSLFRRALARSRERISGVLGALVPGGRPNAETLEELEAALLAADIGPETALELVEAVRTAPADGAVDALAEQMLLLLEGLPEPAQGPVEGPRVVLVVGVNGSGKTTSIAKLARYHLDRGDSVLLAAADTFRAAAIEQLETWGRRVGVDVIAQHDGGDPAAVAYDACQAAAARDIDVLIVDTAGRLHTQGNLMAELDKIRRVTGKVIDGAPHDVLLVLDGTTGQNGLRQAEEFLAHAGVTGIILTKLDGTARGGIALTIARRVGLPIRFVGTGERDADLAEFRPEEYVHGLLG
jgi:fused signal recognition particle receptor